MARVTSALVLAVLLGTAGVRLGCAWSCQPSTMINAGTHCHETPVAASEFSASAGCNDVRSGSALLVAAVRPDAAASAHIDRLTPSLLDIHDGHRSYPAVAHLSHDSSPPAFAIPLRQ